MSVLTLQGKLMSAATVAAPRSRKRSKSPEPSPLGTAEFIQQRILVSGGDPRSLRQHPVRSHQAVPGSRRRPPGVNSASVSPNIIQYFVLSQRKRFLSIAAGGRHVTIWSEADLWRPWSPKASGRKKGSWTSFTIGSEISGGFRSRSTFPLVDCRVLPASEAHRGFLKE